MPSRARIVASAFTPPTAKFLVATHTPSHSLGESTQMLLRTSEGMTSLKTNFFTSPNDCPDRMAVRIIAYGGTASANIIFRASFTTSAVYSVLLFKHSEMVSRTTLAFSPCSSKSILSEIAC